MIEFTCPSCSKHYRVADDAGGRTARCKQCGAAMRVPEAAAAAEADVQEYEQAAYESPVDADAYEAYTEAAEEAAVASVAETPPPSNESEDITGNGDHFAYRISQRPDFALVTIRMEQGQRIYAETSAMVSMTPNIGMKSGFKGGLGKTLGRMLGGENLIINTFTAEEGKGEVIFAAGAMGDAAHYHLTGNSLMLQRGAFMLHSDGVEVTGKWQGAKGFFGGEGLVLLRATGQGDVFFNSFGAILSVDVRDEFIVDTGYVVAFEDTLNYNVSVLPGLRAGGKLKTLFFGGEGLVCRFSGQGRVWIQTRHVQSFLSWVHPFRPVQSRN